MCCRTTSSAVALANRCGVESASSSHGLNTACKSTLKMLNCVEDLPQEAHEMQGSSQSQ
jgi:hypothetical protein